MNKGLTIITLCALCALIPATAYASPVLQESCGLMLRFWEGIRGAVYIMSACALSVISIQASILGKFDMGNFIGLGFGLFVLSMTEPLVSFLTNETAGFGCLSGSYGGFTI
jgi:hypothetical protein